MRLIPLLLLALGTTAQADSVNVYSSRGESLIRPLFDQFTEQTGIEVKVLSADPGALLSRLRLEGPATPADVILTSDAGNLTAAKDANVLQAVNSDILESAIESSLQDQDNQWFGVSMRGRVVVAANRVDPSEDPASIMDLANDKYQGRICVRSSSNVYNQSMLAGIIINHGEQAAETWAEGIVKNFARIPEGNDRAQINAVAEGKCDYALINTYYLGIMLSDPAQAPNAREVRVVFTDQASTGNHANVSGIAMTKHAKNKAAAQKLMEFMVSESAQTWYAEDNHEYPITANAKTSALVKSWTPDDVKFDKAAVAYLGAYNAASVKIFDRVGWP